MKRFANITNRGILPLIALTIILSACSGLGGEPEVVATLRPRATTAPTEPIVFQMPDTIDVALGAEIFADRCTSCHGIGGAGDGETASQLPVRPANFTDPEVANGKTPQDWFQAIYFGNQAVLMPAYGVPSQVSPTAPLNEEQIWAVTMYLFTLSGAEVDMPEATSEATTDTASIEPISTPETDSTVEVADVVATTPDTDSTASPEETPAVVASLNTGIITGSVTNGTADAVVPPDLPVKLYSYDSSDTRITLAETTLSADGTFQFDDVALAHGQEFFVTVGYAGGFFLSETLTPLSGDNTLDLPVTIYETTYDPQAIRVTNILTYANVIESTLSIVQIVEFVNISDKLYVNPIEDALPESLIINLPEGVTFEDVRREFQLSEDGRTATSILPVFPQSFSEEPHTLHFAYSLPYDGDVTLAQTFPYLVEGELEVLIQQNGLSVDGDGFQSRGSRMIAEGVFANYGATLSLMPQTPIEFSIKGTPIIPVEEEQTAQTAPNQTIAIALIGAGVLSIGVAAYIFVQDKGTSSAPNPQGDNKAQINDLMKQIAELDMQHKDGKLPEGEYQKLRDKLKAQLTQLMKNQKTS